MKLIDLGKATVETKMTTQSGSVFDNQFGPQKRF
jgi:hypothetical protein